MRAMLHLLIALSVFASVATAAEVVPAPLEPWRAWALRGQEFRACALIAGHPGAEPADYICAWPGVLDVAADASGASIVERWRVEAETWVPLPGGADAWPQQTLVDGQPAPIVDRGGPAVRLAAGSHEIRARIPWRQRPQTLRVPNAIGLVALSVDGKSVAPVLRNDEDLTLGRGATSAPEEADSIDVRVYRKLADGIPPTLTTEIRFDASGQAREEVLGPVLPPGFEPEHMTSDGPARIDGEGRLHVQLQAGAGSVTIEARALEPLTKVDARVPAAPWPTQEIWSYASDPSFRVTTATGDVQVDPTQADVDEEWRSLPAFALGDGATLDIEQRARGIADDEKNRLTLDRELWLDFAGDGWFAHDRIGGSMLRGWRFDVAPPLALERADATGASERENLLVTKGSDGATGVEWRTPSVALDAGVRIASAATTLPITGWRDGFDRVTTTLHLPSGYRLLAAPGADAAAGSWLSAWTLLDVFVAAIVVLLAARLFGIVGALAAAGYLVFAFHEPGAPLWTLLAALAIALVARALPEGRLAIGARWLRAASIALLVLVALPFTAGELRYALHPQLENSSAAYGGYGAGELGGMLAQDEARVADAPAPMVAASTPAPPPPMEQEATPKRTASGGKQELSNVVVMGSTIRRRDIVDHYATSTVVQTGSGEASWTLGERYVLSWGGPVVDGQTVRLVVAPPWLVRIARVVLIALLALLVVRLARMASLRVLSGATAAAVPFALALLGLPHAVSAQVFPPQNFLDELRAELAKAPECAPHCATIAKASVTARGDEIRVALEAHAATRVALPIIADDPSMTLRSVTVDGTASDGIARVGGSLSIAIARGVHRIELVYATGIDRVALSFPVHPMRAEFAGDGWTVGGLSDDRLLTGTLALTRMREGGAATSVGNGAQRFAPFVGVHRDITLGLDWTVTTTVTRLAPSDGGFTATVPLLPGEHVGTTEAKVENGSVIAAIADGEDNTSWTSTLDKVDAFALVAPTLAERAETWSVTASPMWHVETAGVPASPISPDEGDDFRHFAFGPLPGETLTLRVTKPEAASGATRAIDGARLVTNVGQRAVDNVLTFSLRASQGGEEAITLPRDAEVMNVARNDEALSLRPRDGVLTLPFVPGVQRFEVRFREATPIGFVARSPDIALGAPSANVTLALDLPADRWLLATFGPAEGPAVLYWSELIVVLIVAIALARTRRTPLSVIAWVLLVLGFSTFSWIALLFVVASLFALDWRARTVMPRSIVAFNALQIALAALTCVALVCVAAAIPQGLLGEPDMHVAGQGSTAHALRWFVDRNADALPSVRAITLPLWAYKLAMLAWAIWLANALVAWLKRGFAAWTRDGYWRARPPSPRVDIPVASPPPP